MISVDKKIRLLTRGCRKREQKFVRLLLGIQYGSDRKSC